MIILRVWEWGVSLVAEIPVTVQFQRVTTIRLLWHTHAHTHTRASARAHTKSVTLTTVWLMHWPVLSWTLPSFSVSESNHMHPDAFLLRCCLMSTDTERLLETRSPGHPPLLSHSSWAQHLDDVWVGRKLSSGPSLAHQMHMLVSQITATLCILLHERSEE